MPMLALRVAMITSQQPSSAALPAKQRPAPRRPPAPGPTARRSGEGVARPGRRRPMSTSPGRPPPPSANSTIGQALLARGEQRSFLACGCAALGAGQHGVVVGHHHGARRLLAEEGGVDGADAAVTMPSAGVLRIRSSSAAPARLRRERQRAVFDEAAGVAPGRRCSRARCAGRSCGAWPRRPGGRRPAAGRAVEHLAAGRRGCGPGRGPVIGRGGFGLRLGRLEKVSSSSPRSATKIAGPRGRAHHDGRRGATDAVLHLHRLQHQRPRCRPPPSRQGRR
jgi:hypothetical protein